MTSGREIEMKKDYTQYPRGYEQLQKDIIPWYMRPMKAMLMRLLLTILRDG